jgi:hypothetical protein
MPQGHGIARSTIDPPSAIAAGDDGVTLLLARGRWAVRAGSIIRARVETGEAPMAPSEPGREARPARRGTG